MRFNPPNFSWSTDTEAPKSLCWGKERKKEGRKGEAEGGRKHGEGDRTAGRYTVSPKAEILHSCSSSGSNA